MASMRLAPIHSPCGNFFGCRASKQETRAGQIGIAVALTVVIGGMVLTTARNSEAIPAFARKYNADCAMCHFPVIPRLNNFGQMYRRAGYRTPAEYNKDQELTNVSNFLSARIKTQFSYENNKGTVERTQFTFPDLSLFYAGALSRNFSAFIHASSTNSTNVDFHGHVMGNWGTADNMFMVKIGQMHMLEQEGVGGFDRPTSININPVHTLALTSTNTFPGGSAMAYNFDLRQKGVELAYIHGPGKLAFQISNGSTKTAVAPQTPATLIHKKTTWCITSISSMISPLVLPCSITMEQRTGLQLQLEQPVLPPPLVTSLIITVMASISASGFLWQTWGSLSCKAGS